MTYEQNAIKEMAKVIHEQQKSFFCPNNVGTYCIYGSTEQRGFLCMDCCIASYLIKANYGNIPQALTEFVEFLKKKASWHDTETCDDDYSNLCVMLRNVDETLMEFLNMNDKYEKGTPISWIMSVPISDINCKNALKAAMMCELKLALAELPPEGNKTKIKAIEAEIRRRNK